MRGRERKEGNKKEHPKTNRHFHGNAQLLQSSLTYYINLYINIDTYVNRVHSFATVLSLFSSSSSSFHSSTLTWLSPLLLCPFSFTRLHVAFPYTNPTKSDCIYASQFYRVDFFSTHFLLQIIYVLAEVSTMENLPLFFLFHDNVRKDIRINS